MSELDNMRERTRQLVSEGFDAEHDDRHDQGEIALAAIAYAAPRQVYICNSDGPTAIQFIDPWPFGQEWDKRLKDRRGPGVSFHQRRIDNVTKGGALLAAEIDRLKREKARLLLEFEQRRTEQQARDEAHGVDDLPF